MFAWKPRRQRRDFVRRAQVNRYRARPFRNPYFPKTSSRSLWPIAIAGIAIGGLVAGISFFFTSPMFALTSIRVQGTESINPILVRESAERYLDERKFFLFRADNRFLFSEEELRASLTREFSFQELVIEPQPPDLVIRVVEKPSMFLWESAGKWYLVDDHGTVIRQLPDSERESILHPPPLYGPFLTGDAPDDQSALLQFFDSGEGEVEIGGRVLSEVEVANIRAFVAGLETLHIPTLRLTLDRSVGNWMRVETDRYDILFDPNGDVNRQVANLETVLRDTIPDASALEYVDLRFDDHVYFK